MPEAEGILIDRTVFRLQALAPLDPSAQDAAEFSIALWVITRGIDFPKRFHYTLVEPTSQGKPGAWMVIICYKRVFDLPNLPALQAWQVVF